MVASIVFRCSIIIEQSVNNCISSVFTYEVFPIKSKVFGNRSNHEYNHIFVMCKLQLMTSFQFMSGGGGVVIALSSRWQQSHGQRACVCLYLHVLIKSSTLMQMKLFLCFLFVCFANYMIKLSNRNRGFSVTDFSSVQEKSIQTLFLTGKYQ